MSGRTWRCALCDCTVRKLAEGGNAALMELDGVMRVVHAPCKRLRERADAKRAELAPRRRR